VLAVRVEGLGKEYRLGAQRERYSTLRDRVNKLASAPFRALRGRGERSEQNPPFWALKDVSFEVRPGEVVGIIGRNGAGKSTLLKILSRITEPTEGEVDINGRVGSLLEVGTGFHPELTGRENVYLNGAILGMRRAEIARKFDEIVAFAEVEKFIDTPVKHYSSGMYMRLAFAVAAHLEPEILIIDEVLAVGDAEFQEKCLGKMGDAARDGRTVLFVSHSMGAVRSLCTRGVLLDAGWVQQVGPVENVVADYLGLAPRDRAEFPAGPLRAVEVRQRGDRVEIVTTFQLDWPLPMLCLGFIISDALGHPVCGTNPRLDRLPDFGRGVLRGTITVVIRQPKLRDGRYQLSVWFGNGQTDLATEIDCVTFDVLQTAESGQADPRVSGPIVPDCEWHVSRMPDASAVEVVAAGPKKVRRARCESG